jgi:uncharacterized protein (TIRG00374 family)
MDRRLLLLVNAAVSLALVAVILEYVGLSQVVEAVAHIDWLLILLSVICLFLMDVVMSYRIRLLLRDMGVRLGFLDILRSHFVGMFLSDFTPSRTGYFATAAVLRYNYKAPADKALLSIFGPQIYDFALKVVSGSVAILYILFVFVGPGQGWILIAGAFVISAIIAVMLLTLFSRRFLGLFGFAARIPVASKVYGAVVKMQDSSHVVVKRTPELLLLIALSWSFRSFSWYFAAKALGITVPTPFPEPLFYFFLQPLLTMLEFIPSPTIAGLGLSEGGATLVFSLFGVQAATAATFALIVRFKTTFLHLPAIPEALRIPNALAAEKEMEERGKTQGDLLIPE